MILIQNKFKYIEVKINRMYFLNESYPYALALPIFFSFVSFNQYIYTRRLICRSLILLHLYFVFIIILLVFFSRFSLRLLIWCFCQNKRRRT